MHFDIIPTPKARPRFHIYRGRVLTQTTVKTRAFENQIAELYKAQGGKCYEKGEPLEVIIIFGMPIASGTSKKQFNAMINGTIKHTKRPDVDNMIKSVLDALNGVAFNDDSQIIAIMARKVYAVKPFIDISISVAKAGGET